jgi:hypothetical protein
MASLPTWPEMVGRFGFDPLLVTPNQATNTVRDLRYTLAGIASLSTLIRHQSDLRAMIASLGLTLTSEQRTFLATNWAPENLSKVAFEWFETLTPENRKAVGVWSLKKFYDPELIEFPAISILMGRPGSGAALYPLIVKKHANEIKALPAMAKRILDGLNAMRLQWAGDIVANHDTQALGPNTAVRIRMRFRTWTGPLVFHCHNVEHEDMRMMVNFEATMSGKVNQDNAHDPNIAPTRRTHGQDVTDLETNPYAVGEMPWEAIDGFPHFRFEEKPIPGTSVDEARDSLIPPRSSDK